MKKVLIITYYWPPSGGGGVQRWLKFSKYLSRFGWEPTIFTPENPDFDIKDKSLKKDIVKGTEVITFPIWEPYYLFRWLTGSRKGNGLKQGQVLENKKKSFLQKLSIWIRGNFFIPDPRVFWARPSINFLTDIQKSNHFDLVITTGPPHSMHLIGLGLKKNTGIKWIADFRDPWSEWDLLQKMKISGFAKALHKKLEKRVLENADLVLTVSESWASNLELLGAKRVEVVTNGYDEDDFIAYQIDERPDMFQIGHIGMINEFRISEGLKEALDQLCNDDQEFGNSLHLQLTGIISDTFVENLRKNASFADKISISGYKPHDQVKVVMAESAVLLLLLNQSENAKGHLPGKLFEYLAAGRPILALGPVDSDAAKIIRDTNSGFICTPNDADGIKRVLMELFTMYKEGRRPKQKDIQDFSRKSLTNRLAEVMGSLVSTD